MNISINPYLLTIQTLKIPIQIDRIDFVANMF
jgi:hypothetical protein